ncbi:unnamed protein product [Peronospora belbahrii]|uniref:Prefoldin, alpha subunit n=1 Tax=Peronospora belbahrii TaxID=622444 RepID=A0AAU9L628_9STRA|nr:unnamed protein product [Peronospora belbahrii]CAH0522513.1 unnamed protein product [Peronospora belbahrii]
MISDSESSTVALQRYSAFIEEVLRPQLKETLATRDTLAQEVHEYEELREILQELQSSKLQPLHTLLDVGERFYVRTKVDDTSFVIIDIGLNFHVEMTISEAQGFVQNHLFSLIEKRNKWQAKARDISKHVNLVLASIQQLAALQ